MTSSLVRGKWIERIERRGMLKYCPSSLVRGKWIERFRGGLIRRLDIVFPREREVD